MEEPSRAAGAVRRKTEGAFASLRSFWRSSQMWVGLILAALIGRSLYSPCVRRLFRNVALPGIPEPVAPMYATCSDEDLTSHVSLVVTVKDRCQLDE
eukprot:g20819.t1